MALHVGISDAGDDLRLLSEAVSEGNEVFWFAPSKADAGDKLAIYLHGRGLIAVGTIVERPSKTDRERFYGSNLIDVRWIEPSIPLNDLIARFPDWRWTHYPRSYTTPSMHVQMGLEELLLRR